MKKIKNLPKCKWTLWVRRNSEGEIIEIADWTWKDQPPGPNQGRNRGIAWESEVPFMFEATVKPASYERGRSSINFIFKDVDSGLKYPVSASGTSDLFEAIVSGSVDVNHGEGTFTAIFKWTKKGTAYSVDPVLM